MSRQIKFRAWNPGKRKMLYIGKFKLRHEPDNGLNAGRFDDDGEYIQFNLMQFTGLTDKNGKEIYEGDIVNYDGTPYNVNALKTIGVISMIKHSWSLKYKSKWGDYDGYSYYNLGCEDFFDRKSEIIGNIHEHEHLLNN